MSELKSVGEWIEIYKRDGDGKYECAERIEYMKRFIRAVQENAWSSAIDEACQMCGGDSHIEQGVASLSEIPHGIYE